ncbi:DUF421 domain-containing protein [Natronospora cellulosivora (SeqCode)]
MLIIVMRTVLIYFIVLIFVRIMGKREMGELNPFDFVVAIMIAELAVLAIENHGKPMIDGLAPMIVLVILEIIIAYLVLKSNYIRGLITGKPIILIEKGEIKYKNLAKTRFNMSDLLLQLRSSDVFSIDEVELAILEISGELSVVEKGKKNYDFPIIMDGKLSNNLDIARVSKNWVENYLKQKNLDINDIALATVSENKQVKVYYK